jgi:hypothetical protein
MSDATLNGLAITRGNLTRPFEQAWTAEVELDGDAPLTGRVTLTLLGQDFVGSVVADPSDGLSLSGDVGGYQRCLIVGGAGGLTNPIEPDEFAQGALVQTVLQRFMQAGGETLAADIAPDLLVQVLPQWSWSAGTVRDALSALCENLGVIWRVKQDGTIWIGTPEPIAVAPPEYIVADISPETGQALWALNEVTVEPDQIIDGLTVRKVVYSWEGDEMRAAVTFAPGPVQGLFALFALWLKRISLDHYRIAAGRISTQNGDGTVQFQPDDSRYSGLKKVAIRAGLPDTQFTGLSGRAISGWEGATPTNPALINFAGAQATAQKIKIGVSSLGPPAGTQPTIKGTIFRSSQSSMHTGLATALITAGVELTTAGNDPTLVSLAPLAAAALALAGAALGAGPGGAAKAIQDFEAAAAANSNFLTSIVELG